MALLYVLDDDVAVDDDGCEWHLVEGAWRPSRLRPSRLRLVVSEPATPSVGPGSSAGPSLAVPEEARTGRLVQLPRRGRGREGRPSAMRPGRAAYGPAGPVAGPSRPDPRLQLH